MCSVEGLSMAAWREVRLSDQVFCILQLQHSYQQMEKSIICQQNLGLSVAGFPADLIQRHHKQYPSDWVNQSTLGRVNVLIFRKVIPWSSNLLENRYSSSLVNGKKSTLRICGFTTLKAVWRVKLVPVSHPPVGRTHLSPKDVSLVSVQRRFTCR